MIDEKSPFLHLPLPNAANALDEDVERLRQSLVTLDVNAATQDSTQEAQAAALAAQGQSIAAQAQTLSEHTASLTTQGQSLAQQQSVLTVQTAMNEAQGEKIQEHFAALQKQGKELANITAVTNTFIESKANADLSNCTQPYVTEYGKTSDAWYMKWSNGMLEQWGLYVNNDANYRGIVNIPIEFSNTQYCVYTQNIQSVPYNATAMRVVKRNTTNFEYEMLSNYSANHMWYARGHYKGAV